MSARKLRLPLVLPLAGTLLITAGCSGGDKAEKSDPPKVKAGPSSAQPQTGGATVTEGWFGGPDGLHAKVEIKGVERQAAKSVLKFSVTSMDNAAKSVPFSVPLIDPLGRKMYKPLTAPAAQQFAPGAAQELTA